MRLIENWRRLSPLQIRLTKGVLLASDLAALLWSALMSAMLAAAWSDSPDAHWLVSQDIQRYWAWMAVAGVSALLTTYPAAFVTVQWLGAVYLVWLGAKLLATKMGDGPVLELKPHHYLRQALVITVFNPKAIVFYMAFFPLFVDPSVHQGLVTFAAMAATIAALTFAYGLVLVLLAHFLAARVRASSFATLALNKTAGLLLIVFGLKLALSK